VRRQRHALETLQFPDWARGASILLVHVKLDNFIGGN
jgi:hypothetical protein